MSLVRFDWPGNSWEDVRGIPFDEFVARYGVPARLVPTLLRKQAIGDRRPVEWRSGPAAEMDKIEAGLAAFNGRVLGPRFTAKQLRRARRRIRRERLRKERDARAALEERRRAEAKPFYACRAKHHEHCKGAVAGKKCVCRCHQPRHRARFEEKERAWQRGRPPALPRREGWRTAMAEPAKPAGPPVPLPTTTPGILKANRDWEQAERDRDADLEFARDRRGRPPSPASHPLSEEDVEAINHIYDTMIYGYGWSLDRRVEDKGEQALRAWERLPRYTDERAKPDPWTKDKRRRIRPVRTRRMGRPRKERTPEEIEQQRGRARDRYRANRAQGLCGQCGTGDLAGGTEASCLRCLERDRSRHRRYYARNLERRQLQAARQRMAAALSSVSRRLVRAARIWDSGVWE